ncbi:hypothetical protein ASD37_07505 [Mycobacterium sp. Root135]|uniref:hypothetical protein n=1 Tax=Mycobacterium sp. Root135 TaxID=1736457 RepID=UPI0006F8E93D|nr:hypothetical protein [Mycobacterium sp. Root135]KQY07831.1 hypothetical protein ASD37_07505 [Mycobacterium sp. Root135]
MLTVDALADHVNTQPNLIRRGRFLTATMLLDLGDASYLIHFRDGRVETVDSTPTVMPVWTFALRAPRAEWDKFFVADPAPGSHDIMALMRRRVLTVEGDLHPFIANLQYFKDVLATLRDREVD